jgi:hypothetical protein
MITLPVHTATRYVQPLREGGSLPAIVGTDGGLFVTKFRGAGQGPKALIAEIIVAEFARALDLPVPELALIEIEPAFGESEPDPEIQEILRASHGLNVGLRYLDGAFNFDGHAAGELIDAEFASSVVWLDAFLTNPDRTHRNPNLLIWERSPWLIDHGAAVYAHHAWESVDEARMRAPFPLIKDHVLLAHADDIEAADARLASRANDRIEPVIAAIPDALLLDPISRGSFVDAEDARMRYRQFLTARLAAPREFVGEAGRAREERLKNPIQPRTRRR